MKDTTLKLHRNLGRKARQLAPETNGALAIQATRIPSSHTPDNTLQEAIKRYYAVAGEDYRYWSDHFNMHFGYFRRGISPRNREAMLEEMNRQVLGRLVGQRGDRWLDAGCGLGAVARTAARDYHARVSAVSLVHEQIEAARAFAQPRGVPPVEYLCGDYSNLPLRDGAFDGAYAVESACYAKGADKADFLSEMFRLLRPNGRLVVADGFLKRPIAGNGFVRICADSVCRAWAIEEFAQLDSFVQTARRVGFARIVVEEISWRVAPSFLHIIPVSARFFWRERRRPGSLEGERWNNVKAPLLAQFLGLARRTFGYYLLTLVK